MDKDEKTINNKLNTTDSTKKNLSQDEIKKMLKNGNFKETLRKNNGVLWENEKGDQIWFTGEEFRYRENGGKWTYNTKFTNPKKEEEKKQDTTEVFKEVNVYTIIDRDENRRQGVIVRFQDGNYSMLKYNDYTENNKIIQFEIEYYHKDSKKFKKHYYELIKPYDIDLTDKWTHHRSIFSSWYIKDSKKDCSELFNPIKKIMARIHFLNKKDWESFQELSPR